MSESIERRVEGIEKRLQRIEQRLNIEPEREAEALPPPWAKAAPFVAQPVAPPLVPVLPAVTPPLPPSLEAAPLGASEQATALQRISGNRETNRPARCMRTGCSRAPPPAIRMPRGAVAGAALVATLRENARRRARHRKSVA